MGKLIAIDYGTKRVGLAISDVMQIFAFGLTTIETRNLQDYLSTIIEKEKIVGIVIGDPKTLKNEPQKVKIEIDKFKVIFSKNYPHLPIYDIDERFTSKMAAKTLVDSGLKKKERQNKALLDEVSATIILQSYLANK